MNISKGRPSGRSARGRAALREQCVRVGRQMLEIPEDRRADDGSLRSPLSQVRAVEIELQRTLREARAAATLRLQQARRQATALIDSAAEQGRQDGAARSQAIVSTARRQAEDERRMWEDRIRRLDSLAPEPLAQALLDILLGPKLESGHDD